LSLSPSKRAFFPFELGLLEPCEPEVCMRKLAVSTNWPTAAQKPLRKALKGCFVGVWLLALLSLF
jgi:hypothetical protein